MLLGREGVTIGKTRGTASARSPVEQHKVLVLLLMRRRRHGIVLIVGGGGVEILMIGRCCRQAR